MKLDEMRTALEIVRQRCCMYSAQNLAWMKREGMNVTRLGTSVEWLLEQGVLRIYDREYFTIDRDRCIELFIELSPEEMRQDPRFACDQSIAAFTYKKLADRVETDMRLWMFFREIASAARLAIPRSHWRYTDSCSGYWIKFEREGS